MVLVGREEEEDEEGRDVLEEEEEESLWDACNILRDSDDILISYAVRRGR